MREGAAAVAVTQGPDPGHVRLQLFINDNVPTLVGRHPGPIETQVVGVGNTSDREKNVRAYHFRRPFVASHADGDTVVALRQGYAFRIQSNLYPLSFQNFAHGFRNIFVFTPNQTRSHLDYRDVAPEAAIHLTEFQPDITSADDDETLRQEVDIHHG